MRPYLSLPVTIGGVRSRWYRPAICCTCPTSSRTSSEDKVWTVGVTDFYFGFIEPEQEHRRLTAQCFRETLELIAELQIATNEGFPFLVGRLPRFSKRDAMTVSAALFTRSFKSIHCAVDAALRGYYGASLTLVRPVYENLLVHWELLANPRSVEAMYDNDEKWWKDRRFWDIAVDADRRAAAGGQQEYAKETYRHMYQHLSKFAHPRTQGARIEYNSASNRLVTSPEWDEDHCRRTLREIVYAATYNLAQFRVFVGDGDRAWRERADSAVAHAVVRIKSEAENIKSQTESGGPAS